MPNGPKRRFKTKKTKNVWKKGFRRCKILSPNNIQNTRKKPRLQHTSQDRLAQFSNLLQRELFPLLESALGTLSRQAQLLAAVVSAQPLARWIVRSSHRGRRPCSRQSLATAFFAKAIYNLPTTRHLIQRLQSDTQLRRLCGWDTAAQVPTEATFSRAFAEFAATGLPAQIHAALVHQTQQETVIEHIARDSTAIPARERPPLEASRKTHSTSTEKPLVHAPYKTASGWHRRGQRGKKYQQKRTTAKQRGPRLQRQQHMTLKEMLADLPQECSLGAKKNSQGQPQYWRGYKLHWDVADGRIPISCLLTGAAVHDSQAAIPLMLMSAERVRWKCETMDSAYDAKLIRAHSQKLGHEALIKPNKHHYKATDSNRKLNDEQKQRFKKRTIVEQLNARLKDEFGGRSIYYRGASKVMAHLMFGVVALTVDQLLRLTP